MHSGWGDLQGMRTRGDTDMLLGRSFDLKSAYRQLAVSDDSLKWARLAVYDPHESTTKVFQQYSLPFGAKASVIAFIRCARMIQFLAHRLMIVATCYFDDYVVFSGSPRQPSLPCWIPLVGSMTHQGGTRTL